MPKPIREHKREDQGGARRLVVNSSNPAPTVMAVGVGSVNSSQYSVATSDTEEPTSPNKPPYRVPLMSEIALIQKNGFRTISTFSGCGGSSLGYRLAGFDVLWASEFVPAAREAYAANAPTTILDGRDIRTVQPEEILAAIGMRKGELDLFDGSPPCASFSTAGKRDKHWGKVKKYSDVEQRTDDLFFEYVRILRGLMPKVFVAENVSGLVKGVAKGYFLEILAELKKSGYRVVCKVLDAQWLGVPQCRQRCIFVGVREDLKDENGNPLMPAHPKPLPYRYSVREAIPWITGLGKVPGGDYDKKGDELNWGPENPPAPTIVASEGNRVPMAEGPTLEENMHGETRKNSSDDPCTTIRAKKAGGIKIVEGQVVAQGGNAGFGNQEPRSLDKPTPTIGTSPNSGNELDGPGTLYISGGSGASHDSKGKQFSSDEPLPTILGTKPNQFVLTEGRVVGHKGSDFDHKTRSLDEPAGTEPSQLQGQHHHQFVIEPESDISGYAIGEEWDNMNSPGEATGIEQSDKYFQLVKASPGQPSPTITGEGGNPSIASVTHPTQRRKFSIAELKRICAFPDDFVLTGSYAQQWERLGRAVPPVMMQHIAETVRDEILRKIGSTDFKDTESEFDIFGQE